MGQKRHFDRAPVTSGLRTLRERRRTANARRERRVEKEPTMAPNTVFSGLSRRTMLSAFAMLPTISAPLLSVSASSQMANSSPHLHSCTDATARQYHLAF